MLNYENQLYEHNSITSTLTLLTDVGEWCFYSLCSWTQA